MATHKENLLEAIMRFESDQMGADELVPFFQSLVDTGLAWQLQGSYGRTAHNLLQSGHIHPRADA